MDPVFEATVCSCLVIIASSIFGMSLCLAKIKDILEKHFGKDN